MIEFKMRQVQNLAGFFLHKMAADCLAWVPAWISQVIRQE